MDKIIQAVLDAYASYPVILLLLWLYYRADTERKAIQTSYTELVSRLEKGLADATAAIKSSVRGQEATHQVVTTMRELLLFATRGRLPSDKGEPHEGP